MSEQEQKTIRFIQNRVETAENRVKEYITDSTKQEYRSKRYAFNELNEHLQNYIQNKSINRMLILYGLRGTGKTTLLAHLYNELSHIEKHRKLFISLDRAVNILNITLNDIIDSYETILGAPLEKLQEPVFLFLDEVHFDEKWDITLKTLYDRTDKVFIVATGSSALSLNSPDLSRRRIAIELHPTSFTEYIDLKYKNKDVQQLSRSIQDALFTSQTAEQCFQDIQKIKPQVLQYWAGVSSYEIDKYIKYGTLPFVLQMSDNEVIINRSIEDMIEKVISKDIPHTASLSVDVVSKIKPLLYLLIGTDKLSVNNVSSVLGITAPTLRLLLNALTKSNIIWRLQPYGSTYKQVRQPSKYLFTTSIFRYAYYNLTENETLYDQYKGKLLEDIVGMTLKKIERTHITYDSAAGGADFIIQQSNKHIVMEVGYGNKDIKQIRKTMKKTGIKDTNPIGVLISKNPLKLHEQHNIIEIPLEYFLLA